MRGEANWSGIACIAVIVLTVNGCNRHQPSSAGDWPLAVIAEHDVTVALRALIAENGETSVAATYTPTRAGFHLYSKDLPLKGLSGIGRPTLLEVESGGALVQRGDAAADRNPVPLYVPALHLTFPVYPEGPVTLRLPVTVTRAGGRRVTFSVTYLACSESTCLAPVTRKPIAVALPEEFVATTGSTSSPPSSE